MSAHKDQPPPPLPDKQVLDSYCFVDPSVFGIGLIGLGYYGYSEEIKQFVDDGQKQGYTPHVIAWKSGEYCLVACYRLFVGVDIYPEHIPDDLLKDLVIEAYRTARDPSITKQPPAVSFRFRKKGAAND